MKETPFLTKEIIHEEIGDLEGKGVK